MFPLVPALAGGLPGDLVGEGVGLATVGRVLGGAVEGVATRVLPLVLALQVLGLYGGGPVVTGLDTATERGWQTLTELDSATVSALRRPVTTTAPIAATAERTRESEECPPNAPRYDPASSDDAVRHLFWNVPAMLTARTGVEWSTAYQLRFTSVIASNTAIALLVDPAGCVHRRGDGTFIRGDLTVHAEIQALTQLMQTPPSPGWRLIVHVSARPCTAICAPAIGLWAAAHGVVPEIRVWNKWSLLHDDGFLAICQGIVTAQRARHRGGRRRSGPRAERDRDDTAGATTAV